MSRFLVILTFFFNHFLPHLHHRELHRQLKLFIKDLMILHISEVRIFWDSENFLHCKLIHCTVFLCHPSIIAFDLFLPSSIFLLLLSTPFLLSRVLERQVALSYSAAHVIACPFLSTNVTEFIFANTCHVIATLCSFENMPTLRASFILKVFFEKLHFIGLALSIMNGIQAVLAKY